MRLKHSNNWNDCLLASKRGLIISVVTVYHVSRKWRPRFTRGDSGSLAAFFPVLPVCSPEKRCTVEISKTGFSAMPVAIGRMKARVKMGDRSAASSNVTPTLPLLALPWRCVAPPLGVPHSLFKFKSTQKSKFCRTHIKEQDNI